MKNKTPCFLISIDSLGLAGLTILSFKNDFSLIETKQKEGGKDRGPGGLPAGQA